MVKRKKTGTGVGVFGSGYITASVFSMYHRYSVETRRYGVLAEKYDVGAATG